MPFEKIGACGAVQDRSWLEATIGFVPIWEFWFGRGFLQRLSYLIYNNCQGQIGGAGAVCDWVEVGILRPPSDASG